MEIHVKKGMNLPLGPRVWGTAKDLLPASVGLLARDFPHSDMRLQVEEGQLISPGDLLWQDKKSSAGNYISPYGGEILAIHKDAQGKLLSLEIALDQQSLVRALPSYAGMHRRLSGEALAEKNEDLQ